MDFGQRLKSLRAERNLTQQNLGDAVGVSTVTIRAWERNAKKPAMDALLSLGRALNISIDTLLDFHLENTTKERYTKLRFGSHFCRKKTFVQLSSS